MGEEPHPVLDVSGQLNLLGLGVALHRELFAVFGLNMSDKELFLALILCGSVNNDLSDTFIDFLDMFVDNNRILSLANKLQQIFIGQKVESREVSSLRCEQIIQFLLDRLQVLV